jgi:hypothetical protein
MSNKVFSNIVDIAAEMNKAMGPKFVELILRKTTAGARNPVSLTAGQTKTSNDYSCRGFFDVYKKDEIDGTTVKKNDHKIYILGDSIEGGTIVPEPGDIIVDSAGTTYEIQTDGVTADPALAGYTCHAR